jgi:N-acetylglucosamine kinase-like BadF-type ATPase
MDNNNEITDERSYEFADLISEHLSNPVEMLKFTRKVMENAEDGDSASLKMIQQALSDVKYQKDKKQIVTDEQLKRIVQVTSDRDRA